MSGTVVQSIYEKISAELEVLDTIESEEEKLKEAEKVDFFNKFIHQRTSELLSQI